MFIGFGSAIFHPEGSRVSFMAAGSKRGFSQSIYQVGGNSGQAFAPLISAFILCPPWTKGTAIFILVAALAIFILIRISAWYKEELVQEKLNKRKRVLLSSMANLTKKQIGIALTLTFNSHFCSFILCCKYYRFLYILFN